MLDVLGKHEDRISHDMAQILSISFQSKDKLINLFQY